jgi:hypothetical protein
VTDRKKWKDLVLLAKAHSGRRRRRRRIRSSSSSSSSCFGCQLRVFHNHVTRIFELKMGRIAEPDQFITSCGRKRMTNRQGAKK